MVTSANANIQLWTVSDAGYNPNNLYRNSLARYFLPSVDEWYKAAYYDPTSGVYYNYPTGSDSVPDGIDFAGDPNFDAVFNVMKVSWYCCMSYHCQMRVITVNVCGIRSAAAKGLFRWLRRQQADFICLQETKSQEHQLAEHDVRMGGYHSFFCDAERPGYAGVAIYTPPRAGQGRARLRHARVRQRGPLPRGPGGGPVGGLAVPALGLRRAPSARPRSSASSRPSTSTWHGCAAGGATTS